MMPGFDMHIHTPASDGLCPIEKIIELAQAAGLDGIAITDHDTVFGLAEAQKIAKTMSFPLIPGIELSADWEGIDVHILGYWIDYDQSWLIQRLELLQEDRLDRCYRIARKLAALKMPIDAAAIIKSAGASVGRPHIAKAMVQKGYVTTEKEAFRKWLGKGMQAYVPRVKFSPFEALDMIQRAGGAAVLAHPATGVPDSLVGPLAHMGLAGIEVYHPEHNHVAENKYLRFARYFRLAILGGSDFHGRPDRQIGCKTTALMQLERLAAKREMIK
ncbi:MAG: PHP domain-containing protein [Bacillota bacterium]|jgi:predicted metal-dependent phosphoesterase TrpH